MRIKSETDLYLKLVEGKGIKNIYEFDGLREIIQNLLLRFYVYSLLPAYYT